MATTALWTWRLSTAALLAAGVFVLWQQVLELRILNAELVNLVNYLSVIAERSGS